MERREDGALPRFAEELGGSPDAIAEIRGRGIFGLARFFTTPYGVLVVTRVDGLPRASGRCSAPIFAYHIHEGTRCTDGAPAPFAGAGGHYNPDGCPHPAHRGDLPPLFGAGGMAFSAVLTDRFTVNEVLGKTVIIHADPDDFTTQPAGNAGRRLACGEIKTWAR